MKTTSLTNSHLSLTLLPEIGARIDSLIDLRHDREWVWHPEGYVPGPRVLSPGAGFDDIWTGGWDEIFPNDAAAVFRGRELFDHGELWSQPWEQLSESPLQASLAFQCTTVPVRVTKTITLRPKAPSFTLEFLFEHTGDQELPFLFKLHPAVALRPGSRLLLPRCVIQPVDLGFSTRIGRMERSDFPHATSAVGERISIDTAPDPGNEREFFYAMELQEGWCGVADGERTLRFHFDPRAFPYVWMFQSYGGWRGHYVVVAEPATTMPWDLDTALKDGTCAVLPPRSQTHYRVDVEVT